MINFDVNGISVSYVDGEPLMFWPFEGFSMQSKPTVDKETKTILKTTGSGVNEKLVASTYRDGCEIESKEILPAIKKIKVINQNEYPIGVIVDFVDGSREKSICNLDYDQFNFSTGLSICMFKRMLGFGNNFNTAIYNKLTDYAMKTYTDHTISALERAEKNAESERIKKNRQEKRARKRARQDYEDREYEIDMMAEAIRRANNGKEKK